MSDPLREAEEFLRRFHASDHAEDPAPEPPAEPDVAGIEAFLKSTDAELARQEGRIVAAGFAPPETPPAAPLFPEGPAAAAEEKAPAEIPTAAPEAEAEPQQASGNGQGKGNIQDIPSEPPPTERPAFKGTANHGQSAAEMHMATLLRAGITSAELALKDFPIPRWVIPALLPEGLALLAGKPKTGKSWLALNIAAAVSIGGNVLGTIAVERGLVLYLALEDTERRLKGRLDLIKAVPTDKLHFFTAWSKGEKALEDLRLLIACNPDSRLVVIDTLQRIRETSENGYSYSDDVEWLGKLATLATGRRLCIMCLHHTRKMAAADFIDTVSGTAGVTGSADTVWALQRPRNTVEATLSIAGRDLEEKELSLRYDPSVGWASLGDASEHRRSQEREEVLSAIRDAGGPISPRDVAETLGKNPATVRGLIRKLRIEGAIFEFSTGKYTVIGHNGGNGTTEGRI